VALRIYVDEDLLDHALVGALRSNQFDVLTTSEAGRRGDADERQLEYAVLEKRAILTGNQKDFVRIHRAWLSTGRIHAGIIVVSDRRVSPGVLAAKLVILDRRQVGALANSIVFLNARPLEEVL
jgi:Domain of unknown function (DUF5615)